MIKPRCDPSKWDQAHFEPWLLHLISHTLHRVTQDKPCSIGEGGQHKASLHEMTPKAASTCLSVSLPQGHLR